LTQGKKRQTGDREWWTKIQQQQLISGCYTHDILSSLSSSSHLFSLGHRYRFISKSRKRDRDREGGESNRALVRRRFYDMKRKEKERENSIYVDKRGFDEI
jgi:hypothetical protein